VLAEREFRIGRFYYLKESWSAAIARLKSLTDAYPLYSGVDDALFMLGQSYEHAADNSRAIKDEALRARTVKDLEDHAAAAYDRILTRYPVMGRAKEARARLEALHRPIPKATPEAIAQNKQEEDSRREMGHFSRLMINFHRRPDVSQASKVGDPTLVPPKETSATDVTREVERAMVGSSGGGPSAVTGAVVGTGPAPSPNQPVPHSASGGTDNSIPELKPTGDAGQLATQAPQPAPAQVNEAAGDSQSSSSTAAGSQQASSNSSSGGVQGSNDAQSSSKKKKKKKLWPF